MDEISISLQLPLDKDGFLRRECPYCGRQFKQWQDKHHKTQESPESYYCPYCYSSADANAWYTAQQIEYIQQQAMAEVVGPNLYRLQEQLEQASQSGLFRVEMTCHMSMEPEPLIEFNDMVQLVFSCHVREYVSYDCSTLYFRCGAGHQIQDRGYARRDQGDEECKAVVHR
jgi:hypothetical protein